MGPPKLRAPLTTLRLVGAIGRARGRPRPVPGRGVPGRALDVEDAAPRAASSCLSAWGRMEAGTQAVRAGRALGARGGDYVRAFAPLRAPRREVELRRKSRRGCGPAWIGAPIMVDAIGRRRRRREVRRRAYDGDAARAESPRRHRHRGDRQRRGHPRGEHRRIFDRFYRTSAIASRASGRRRPRARHRGGRIVDAHRGRVRGRRRAGQARRSRSSAVAEEGRGARPAPTEQSAPRRTSRWRAADAQSGAMLIVERTTPASCWAFRHRPGGGGSSSLRRRTGEGAESSLTEAGPHVLDVLLPS